MSYDRDSSTLRKEGYNNPTNQQISLFGMHNNDDIYLESNDQVNSINYRTKPSGNNINNSAAPSYGMISQQLIQQSNHKPTLINHQFAFDDEGSLDKSSLTYINQQINNVNQNQRNYQQPNIQNNYSLPLYQFGSNSNVNNGNIGLSQVMNNSGNTNLNAVNNMNGIDMQSSQQPQQQQHINQSHFIMNYGSNILGNNYNDMLDQFQNFEEIKNDDDEEYCLNSENTSSENGNNENNDNIANNNNPNSTDNTKQYICEYEECKKIFKAKKSLRDHLRIHTNQRPYQCQEPNCGKSFVQYSSLQKHSRTHKGDRPYKCDYYDCDQAFTQVSNLKRHQKIHSNDKPYECTLCVRKFTTSSNLKQHLITHESQRERQRFKCQIDECGKSYLYSSSLKKHEKEHILNSNPKAPLLASAIGVKGVNENCEMHGNKISKRSKFNNNIHSDEIIEEEEEEEMRQEGEDIDEEEEDEEEEEEDLIEDEEEEDEDQENIYPQKLKNQTKKEISGVVNNQSNNMSPFSESSNSQGQKPQKKKTINGNNNSSNVNSNTNQNQGMQNRQMMQNQTKVNTEEMDMLNSFFNSHHVALQHDGHYDVLFKGFLYHYNKKTGKIEIHDIQAQDEIKKGTCQPLSELTHNSFEDMQKKINEIEYRYNDTEILNQACNPLSCKCAQNGSKGCCSSENGNGMSSCCCSNPEKEDTDQIKNTQPTSEVVYSAVEGGCCSKTNKDIKLPQQNIDNSTQYLKPQNQHSTEINEVVCCNEPNCTMDTILIVAGNQEKDSCCSQINQSNDNKIVHQEQNQIDPARNESCCSGNISTNSQAHQNDGNIKISNIQSNETIYVRQQPSQNQNVGAAQIKTEDCCCTIDQVKIECTCIGCDEDCQSCSKSTKCIYKVQLGIVSKDRQLSNQSLINNPIEKVQSYNNNQNLLSSSLQQELPSQENNQDLNMHHHHQDGHTLQAGSIQYEIIEPKEQNNNQNYSASANVEDKKQQQPKCICNDTKDLKHLHGPNCGHIPIYHHGHLDYIVENQLHHPHGSHCDFHGTVNVLDNIVKI